MADYEVVRSATLENRTSRNAWYKIEIRHYRANGGEKACAFKVANSYGPIKPSGNVVLREEESGFVLRAFADSLFNSKLKEKQKRDYVIVSAHAGTSAASSAVASFIKRPCPKCGTKHEPGKCPTSTSAAPEEDLPEESIFKAPDSEWAKRVKEVQRGAKWGKRK